MVSIVFDPFQLFLKVQQRYGWTITVRHFHFVKIAVAEHNQMLKTIQNVYTKYNLVLNETSILKFTISDQQTDLKRLQSRCKDIPHWRSGHSEPYRLSLRQEF